MSSRFAAALLLGALAAPGAAAGPGAELARLRAELSRSWTDPEAHLRLARHHERAGRRILAFHVMQRLRDREPLAFREAFAHVFLDATIDASDGALEALLARLEETPKNAELAVRIGRAYLQRREVDRAGEFFAMAHVLEPDDRRHVERMVDLLNRLGENRRATELLAAWDRDHPDSAFARAAAVQQVLDAGDVAEARRLAKAALEAFPDDCELTAQRGYAFAAEGKMAEAHRFLLRAPQLCPERARLHGALATFSIVVLRDPVRALDHYLDAYFRDPNYHDGEYVDVRISALAHGLAQAIVERDLGECRTAECLAPLLESPNPAVAMVAMERVREHWDEGLQRPLIALLDHDDPELRAGAMLLLADKAGEGLAIRIDALLGSIDPRRLGMGAQLAVRRRGPAGLEAAARLLTHPEELVRFDAITALALEGGPRGRRLVAEHAERESSPALQAMARKLGGSGS